MAIHIDWQPLPPKSGNEETYYFPRLKGNGTINMETLCRKAAKNNPLYHRSVLMAAFGALQREMSHWLAMGKTIRIQGFGTFRPTIEANGKVKAAQRRKKDAVRLKGITFSPEKEFMDSLGQLDFRWHPSGSRHLAYDAEELKTHLTEFFATHASITRAEFASIFHLGDSTANKYLRQLQDHGFLTRKGAGKHICYVLNV